MVEDIRIELTTSCLQGKLTIIADEFLMSIKSVETKGLLEFQ